MRRMRMTPRHRLFRAAAWLTAVLVCLPFQIRAGQLSWPQETDLRLDGSGITLKISAGSQADSLAVNPTSFTVTVAAGETFTVRYPGPGYGTMSNDGGLSDCNIVGGDNVAAVNGPKTVTFTPSAATCAPPSGGGSGGGGGTTGPSIRLYAPNGGETLVPGSLFHVFWTYTGSQARGVRLSLSRDGGLFETVASGLDHARGYHDWTVPPAAADISAIMRSELLGSGGETLATDASDGTFLFDAPAPTPPPLGGPTPSPMPTIPYDPTATISGDKSLVEAGTLAAWCRENELVKLPDDGDPVTQADSAVYYCGADGKRYVFPNAETYSTWYADFSRVKVVAADVLAALPIGGNVTYRPGLKMIKIQTDPKTYAVGRGGVLRQVPDEATAASLFGPSWNGRIDDIDVAFFPDYRIGPPLASMSPG